MPRANLRASLWAHNLTAARGAVLGPAPVAGAPLVVDAAEQYVYDEPMLGGSDDSDGAEDSE